MSKDMLTPEEIEMLTGVKPGQGMLPAMQVVIKRLSEIPAEEILNVLGYDTPEALNRALVGTYWEVDDDWCDSSDIQEVSGLEASFQCIDVIPPDSSEAGHAMDFSSFDTMTEAQKTMDLLEGD